MKMLARTWVVIALLLTAVLTATSCAEMREKQVREVVTQYLDAEKANDYQRQYDVYDVKSLTTLPPPVGDIPNPFAPNRLVSYDVKAVTVYGATAQAQVDEAFQMLWSGGLAGPVRHYNFTVYAVHQTGGWKVDELQTRTRALDALVGPGAGDNWLAERKRNNQLAPQ
jgi:hypothetical protein